MLNLLFACVLLVILAAGCEPQQGALNENSGRRVLVGAAASIAPLLREHFAQNPEMQVESGGSLSILRRQQQLGRAYDILVLADPKLAKDLSPEHWKKPALVLAQSRLVFAIAPSLQKSIKATELMQAPHQLALANPELAPLGYRSSALLEAWRQTLESPEQERFSRWLSTALFFPDAALTALSLQTGRAQSAILYESTARAFGLKSLVLSEILENSKSLNLALSERLKQGERGAFIAILSKKSSAKAKAFFAQLQSASFQKKLGEFGFSLLEPAP